MNESLITQDSSAVQSHLGILQSIIQRMATNSSSAKTWCITLVSAILVVVADKDKSEYALIAVIPIFLFFVLDAYYLALEKMFRASYNTFINKLHRENIVPDDLYAVLPQGNVFKSFFCSIASFSIWPFYIVLLITVIVAQQLIMS